MVKMRSDVPERQLNRTVFKANKSVCGEKNTNNPPVDLNFKK